MISNYVSRLLRRFTAVAMVLLLSLVSAVASEFNRPWKDRSKTLVIDAYEYTPIDWQELAKNRRLTAFINKATDGLAPPGDCQHEDLCRARWRLYMTTRELYHTRKRMAKSLGLKWGAYHLGRPGNPAEQAHHFVWFTQPEDDDLIAIDIEDNDPSKWMSLEDAEIFAKVIKARTGRYPVLYTNHSTAQYIARNRAELPILSRLHLWYARYRSSTRGTFPMGNWDTYSLWQFSKRNCRGKRCSWRIRGADRRIDVNVVAMTQKKLRAAWPFEGLLPVKPDPEPELPVIALSKAVVKTELEIRDEIAATRIVDIVVAAPAQSKSQPKPAADQALSAVAIEQVWAELASDSDAVDQWPVTDVATGVVTGTVATEAAPVPVALAAVSSAEITQASVNGVQAALLPDPLQLRRASILRARQSPSGQLFAQNVRISAKKRMRELAAQKKRAERRRAQARRDRRIRRLSRAARARIQRRKRAKLRKARRLAALRRKREARKRRLRRIALRNFDFVPKRIALPSYRPAGVLVTGVDIRFSDAILDRYHAARPVPPLLTVVQLEGQRPGYVASLQVNGAFNPVPDRTAEAHAVRLALGDG